jgi:hypothetical protein
MTTAIRPVAVSALDLPPGVVPLLADGLLSNVRRDCPTHGAQSACVGRHADAGCLVFWCPEAGHHFSSPR